MTRNQVELMQIDNVASPEMPGFETLEFHGAVEEVLQECCGIIDQATQKCRLSNHNTITP